MWHIRQRYEDFAEEIYELYPTLMSMKMHHGGFFTKGDGRQYLNGKITYVDLIDTGSLSLHDLVSVTQELGYPDHEVIYYYFMRPDSDMCFGLQALRNEEDLLMLLNYFPQFKLFDVYTEHCETNLDNYSKTPHEYDVEIQELPYDKLLLEWHSGDVGEGSGLGQDGIDVGMDEVTGPWQDKCIVDVQERSCSCRRWELTGMPCKHAVATNWYMALNGADVRQPENWVHPCYLLNTWKNVYSFKMSPINGPTLWPKSNCPTTITPPKHHVQVGRPKKKRKRTKDELIQSIVKGSKISRAGTTVTCAKCCKKGHNSRTCRGQGV